MDSHFREDLSFANRFGNLRTRLVHEFTASHVVEHNGTTATLGTGGTGTDFVNDLAERLKIAPLFMTLCFGFASDAGKFDVGCLVFL